MMGRAETGELDRFVDLCEGVIGGDPWHGPSILSTLDGVSPRIAFAHVGACPFTIWQLVKHMTAWQQVVLDRLAGGSKKLPANDNWPLPPEQTAEAWDRAREEFRTTCDELLEAVGRIDTRELPNPAVAGSEPRYVHLHGVLHHDVYHSAQIMTLKKLLS